MNPEYAKIMVNFTRFDPEFIYYLCKFYSFKCYMYIKIPQKYNI